jgi:hypothetical protein
MSFNSCGEIPKWDLNALENVAEEENPESKAISVMDFCRNMTISCAAVSSLIRRIYCFGVSPITDRNNF